MAIAAAAPASALDFYVDPAQSAITPSAGAPSPITGTMRVRVGHWPPSSNTTFDVIELALASGPYTIGLQPIATPGLGVLAPSGSFLIPTLFMTLDDGATSFDLAVPDITGLMLMAGVGCDAEYCMQTSFEIDAGPAGLVGVTLFATPEPGTAVLVGAGLAGLAAARRRIRR